MTFEIITLIALGVVASIIYIAAVCLEVSIYEFVFCNVGKAVLKIVTLGRHPKDDEQDRLLFAIGLATSIILLLVGVWIFG